MMRQFLQRGARHLEQRLFQRQAFQCGAHLVELVDLVDVQFPHEAALFGADRDEAFHRQPLQGFTDGRAADAKVEAELGFRDPGAGIQRETQDALLQLVIDGLGGRPMTHADFRNGGWISGYMIVYPAECRRLKSVRGVPSLGAPGGAGFEAKPV